MFKGAKQECFHTYQPLTKPGPMPVIITNECRAGNKIKLKNKVDNDAAAWYGFARFNLGKCSGKLK